MADAGYLTIGKVVRKLQGQYPDLSVSKVRYLEDEGLLDPSRTPGGYRLYSPKDIRRLETILHLQKTAFLPLSVIKDQLDSAESGQMPSDSAMGAELPVTMAVDADDVTDKLHPIEHVPDLLGISVSFVRQLAEVGVISLKRSPHGRDLVDGRDFQTIRTADALRRYGIEPKNLRQYVTAANRESGMFEQALVVFAHKQGEDPAEQERKYAEAFDQILRLTNSLRGSLIKRTLKDGFKGSDQ
ncbi:MAG: MerR family transcriptional regulator [Atopobiaceae bacterium]|jgi:DNA-binding transcriptional MerR regulator|nr:MerR family transcriptional regulator [Atopobiaceae bacterium]MCI2173221.1 MerR family transcriptional regulator [Atopobiaceae bacterium]MCI2207216.1 MerR family transcriptional regulator [Atopobiaceae bacterium]